MPRPLRRILLSDQAVEALRDGLREGRWAGSLPSEHELGRELQISRVTLRKALGQIALEGLIQLGGKGLHHRILGDTTRAVNGPGKIIRLLAPYTPLRMGSLHLVIWDAIREKLGLSGFSVEYEYHPKLYQQQNLSELGRLDSLPGTAGWVLFYATEELQRWFSENGRPCVVLGPVYPGVKLPNVYPDTVASARHATGIFHANGHRELAYLMPEVTSLGDRKGARTFLAEAEKFGMKARIHHYEGNIESLRRTLAQAFLARPRPTGFFSYDSPQCLTIIGMLARAGLKIPRDASVLAGWDDSVLEYAVPSIAHYRVDGVKTGRRAAQLLMDVIEKGRGKARSIAIIPDFVAGESFGPLGRG